MAYTHREAKPICRIRQQRFTNKLRNWRLLDVSIGLAGNIAVSGYDFRTNRTFIDIFSSPQKKFGIGTKPPLLYSREFVAVRGYSWRYVCFLEEPTKIVTGVDNTLEVIATDENKVLRSFEVNDIIRCVSVSEKNIFIGSLSGAVYVFDKVLNFLETIRLEGLQNVVIEDVLEDMEVVPGRFFVCTHKCMPLWDKNRKALAFRGTNGKELHTFTTQDARGVAASLEYGILCVLFSNRLAVFSLSGYHCIFVVDMDSCADKVSISNRGIMVTGEQETGEVKIYDIKALLTYDYLKKNIAFLLQGSDVTKLLTHFDVSKAKTNYIMQRNSPKEALLRVLEDECIIESSNVKRLKEAFEQLKLKSCFYAVEIYQKTRDSSTSYERFLTKFSSHLSGGVLTRLCEYFKVSGDLKKGILGSQNPGYSLLLNLSDREVITESNVTSLEEPMGNFGLAEAVADIRKYQLTVEEQKRELQSDADLVVPVSTSSSLYKIDYRTERRPIIQFRLSRDSSYPVILNDEEGEFTFSPYSSSSLIHQRDAERWKQDPDILPSLPKTSYTQQEPPSFLQNMKKWLGFDQPELRGAAGDDSYLTSELDDGKKSKNVQQQRPSFLTDLKKWFGFGQPELKPSCNLEDINESTCKESVRSEKPESAYIKRRPTLIVPESKSSGKGASSSARQSMRNQTGEIFENVAQEEGNSTDTVFLRDVYPFQKRTKWTKGAKEDPTGSLEADTLDATRGPQSVEMETIRKSDNIVEETKTPPTETEIQENLEDLEKVTQIPIETSAALSLDFNRYQVKDLTDIEGVTNDDQFFFRTGGIKCLEATSSISKEGGLIEIPQSGVKLYIQPNSFSRDDEVHLITVKILLRRLFDDPASCFEHHSAVMVEVLPNNLKLEREAKLTLPHCLILKHPEYSDVQIFHSHHAQGHNPQWENIANSVRCEVSEASCSIWIKNFSWIKCEIGGKYIEGKKLFVYTLGEKFTKDSNNVTAEVGYFPALPGNDRILRDADFCNSMRGTVYESKLPEMFRGTWQPIFFRKEPRNSLMISISEIIPDGGWAASPGSACRKEISYQNIEMSIEQNWPFTFQRKQSEASFPVVHFKVFQGDESFSTPVYVNMEKGLMKEESDVASNDQPSTLLELGDQHISKMSPVCANNNEVIEVNRTSLMLSSVTGNQQERQFLQHRFLTWPNVVEHTKNHLMTYNPLTMPALPQSIPCEQPSLQIFQEFTHNEISQIACCLDTGDPLGRDWKKLADYLNFSYGDVMNFEKQPSPTEAVIRSACKSGTLTDTSQLKSILHKMGRKDAATILECQTE